MSSLKALINPVTPFEQNAPIIYCENTKKCAFVDPGGDIDKLLHIAKDFDLIPEKILLTHGHADHAGGAMQLSQTLKFLLKDHTKKINFCWTLSKIRELCLGWKLKTALLIFG